MPFARLQSRSCRRRDAVASRCTSPIDTPLAFRAGIGHKSTDENRNRRSRTRSQTHMAPRTSPGIRCLIGPGSTRPRLKSAATVGTRSRGMRGPIPWIV
jgi:hypothetical protein